MLKVTYGKTFKTRAGKVGRYKYHNGKKVKFVAKAKSNYRSKRRY
jgi:hypothetical protein